MLPPCLVCFQTCQVKLMCGRCTVGNLVGTNGLVYQKFCLWRVYCSMRDFFLKGQFILQKLARLTILFCCQGNTRKSRGT